MVASWFLLFRTTESNTSSPDGNPPPPDPPAGQGPTTTPVISAEPEPKVAGNGDVPTPPSPVLPVNLHRQHRQTNSSGSVRVATIVVAIATGVALIATIVSAAFAENNLTLTYVLLAIYGLLNIEWIALRLTSGAGSQILPWVMFAVFISLGVVGLVVFSTGHQRLDWLGVAGAVCVVAAVGWLVEILRGIKPLVRIGLLLMVAGLVAAGLALWWLLTGHPGSVLKFILYALVGLGLAAVVVGFNLLSEQAVTWLRAGHRLRLRWVAVIAGTAIFAGLSVLATVTQHSWGLWLGVAGIAAVLMLAIVSDSHLDVAIIIGALTLLAIAPATATYQNPVIDYQGALALKGIPQNTVVALGDSYMSGEGSGIYYEGTDHPGTGSRDQCRRSPQTFPALALTDATFVHQTGLEHLLLLACSGALTGQVIRQQDDPNGYDVQSGEPGTQLDQLNKILQQNHNHTKPALVLIAIGGNDAGFGSVGQSCLAPGNCADLSDPHSPAKLFNENLTNNVPNELDTLFASITKMLPGVPVVAVPYPQPVDTPQNAAAGLPRCDGTLVTASERAWVYNFIQNLDSTIEDAAADAHISYMDNMQQAFTSHGDQLCGNHPTGWHGAAVYPLALKSVNGLATERFNPTRWFHNSLHPDAVGHRDMMIAFRNWMAIHPLPSLPRATDPDAAKPTTTQPGHCGFSTDPKISSCERAVGSWEAGQVGALWWRALIALVAVAALWVACVGAVAFIPKRRVHPHPLSPIGAIHQVTSRIKTARPIRPKDGMH
jgi:GDSL-like Lipase/Acylhydrolase family